MDVTGSAFFDVFGFELSSSAVFDPVCEFLNPWLHPDYQLSACAQALDEEAAYEEEYSSGEYVMGREEISIDQGSFEGTNTGNVAGGVGGGFVGGVAGGSAGFIGGGLGGGVAGR